MFSRPSVSVIVASYNHAHFVREAIMSVLDQNIEPIEILVVDDGSSDNTAEIVAAIRDPRIRLFKSKENRCVHPRNFALARARGKYIAFQNSDDVWLPDKLDAQLNILTGHPEVVACFTDAQAIDNKGLPTKTYTGQKLFETKNRTRFEWLRYFFDLGNCLFISSAIVRRDALIKVGTFDESLFLLSDLDMWVRLAGIGELHVIDKPLTKMRFIAGKNLSAPSLKNSRQSTLEYASILQRFIQKPVIDSIPNIFSGALDPCLSSEELIRAQLARHAWGLGPAQRLFADQLVAHLLRSASTRQDIVNTFGVKFIKDFISHRSALAINVVE